MKDRRIDGFSMVSTWMPAFCAAMAPPRRARAERMSRTSRCVAGIATLIPSGAHACGMPITLPRGELERWYGAAGLDPYRPEALRAHCRDGCSIPALCYNLVTVPRREERHPNDTAPLQ